MDIEAIKQKVLANNFKVTAAEKIILSECYYEITKLAGRSRVLNLGCDSCMLTALKVIGNYIKFHYEEPTIAKAIVEVVSVEKTYIQLVKECKDRDIKIPNNAKKHQLINLLK